MTCPLMILCLPVSLPVLDTTDMIDTQFVVHNVQMRGIATPQSYTQRGLPRNLNAGFRIRGPGKPHESRRSGPSPLTQVQTSHLHPAT